MYMYRLWAEPLREQRGPGKKAFMRAKCTKIKLINYLCRHGQLINGVGSTCSHASKTLSTLTVKSLLIFYPSVHSLSPDNVKDKETA